MSLASVSGVGLFVVAHPARRTATASASVFIGTSLKISSDSYPFGLLTLTCSVMGSRSNSEAVTFVSLAYLAAEVVLSRTDFSP
jgi:hypothetical protein